MAMLNKNPDTQSRVLNEKEFIAVEDVSLGNSVVIVSRKKKDLLGFWNYAVVLLKGVKGDRETVCQIMVCDRDQETAVRDNMLMNNCVRNALGVNVGDRVLIKGFPDIQPGKKVYIIPLQGFPAQSEEDNMTMTVFDVFLRSYFQQTRAVHQGNTFPVSITYDTRLFALLPTPTSSLSRFGPTPGPGTKLEFRIIKTDPWPFCFVERGTILNFRGRDFHLNMSYPCSIDSKWRLFVLLENQNTSDRVAELLTKITREKCEASDLADAKLLIANENLVAVLRTDGLYAEAVKINGRIVQYLKTKLGPFDELTLNAIQMQSTLFNQMGMKLEASKLAVLINESRAKNLKGNS